MVSIMFTVDVETDWAGAQTRGIREALPRLLDLLRRYSATATFFVVGNLTSLVRNHLHPDGPDEVASHGLTHRLLTKLDAAELWQEVDESRRTLEAVGYRVEGFRAPFFRSPRVLPDLLAQAGYRYDASCGAVYPSLASRGGGPATWNTTPPLHRVETSALRDGLTPCSLTYLRLYHPFGLKLVSPRTRLFYCHLHEFLDDSPGWQRLPSPLRWLHRRKSGSAAWNIVERLLRSEGRRFVSCREFLASRSLTGSSQAPGAVCHRVPQQASVAERLPLPN